MNSFWSKLSALLAASFFLTAQCVAAYSICKCDPAETEGCCRAVQGSVTPDPIPPMACCASNSGPDRLTQGDDSRSDAAIAACCSKKIKSSADTVAIAAEKADTKPTMDGVIAQRPAVPTIRAAFHWLERPLRGPPPRPTSAPLFVLLSSYLC